MAANASMKGRRDVFGVVCTALQVGYTVVAVAIVGVAALVAIEESPVRFDFGHWAQPVLWAIAAVPILHFLLLPATALWSGMAAHAQSRVSSLWAWLGYFIPVAGYWLPLRTLQGLVTGSDRPDVHLRALILAWGMARNLASPSVSILFTY